MAHLSGVILREMHLSSDPRVVSLSIVAVVWQYSVGRSRVKVQLPMYLFVTDTSINARIVL